jgi:tRNA pseudouridine55 synthase
MARRKRPNLVHGWVNFDKPLGMTSTQAVGKVRWLFGAGKAGHAGTLDPLATGILPIALGEATKTVPFMVEAAKSYDCTMTWGAETDTLDMEGDIIARSDVRPSGAQLADILGEFMGEIEQIPPAYSAIKINGERAYDLARAGEAPEMKPRTVRIDGLEVLEVSQNTASLRIDCGKGTYIRSLVRDIAHKLGTYAHVSALRRTQVGPFTDESCFSLDALEELRHKGGVLDSLLAVETALDDIPALALTEDEYADVKQGRVIVLHPTTMASIKPAFRPRMIGDVDASRYVVVTFEGVMVALCEARAGALRPKRVFNI